MYPSIRSANVLFLLSMLLVVTAGSFMQTASLAWGLIGTELLLILLPAFLFLKLGRLPARQTLRLHWPGAGLVLLSLLLGIALSFVARWLETLTIALFGYYLPLPPEF